MALDGARHDRIARKRPRQLQRSRAGRKQLPNQKTKERTRCRN